MNELYSTGNPIVDANAKISITGNMIPQTWYKTILRESRKPYFVAIIILADIVYWYKPTEIREEGSGQVVAVKKKFKADLLQRSYQQLADGFGISKKEAANAVIYLEKLGVLKRVFRTINMNGIVINNVLFLELIIERLKEITYPVLEKEKQIAPSLESERVEENRGEFSNSMPDTTIPTENVIADAKIGIGIPFTSERVSPQKEVSVTSSNISYPPQKELPVSCRGDTNTKNTTENTTRDYTHPILSNHETEKLFKDRIDYDSIRCDMPYEIKQLDEIVNIAVDILSSSKKTIRVNQEEKPLEIVKNLYWKLNLFSIKYVLNSLSESKTKARNIRAVIITALYNAPMTYNHFVANVFSVTENRICEQLEPCQE